MLCVEKGYGAKAIVAEFSRRWTLASVKNLLYASLIRLDLLTAKPAVVDVVR